MSDYLRLVKDSVGQTCRLAEENRQLDQNLCNYLAECLKKANEQLTGDLYDSLPPDKRERMLKELDRIVYKAESLVRRCSCGDVDWLTTAFTQACLTHREEISDILHDLEWCLDLLFEHAQFLEASVEKPQILATSSKTFSDMLCSHERKDLNHLKKKLCSLMEGEEPHQHVQVVKYLLEKVEVVIALKNNPSAVFPKDFWKFNLISSESEGLLGEGAAGSVHKTKCLDISCAKKSMLCSEDRLEAFRKQASSFAMMGHPHVLRVLCFVPDAKGHLAEILMELMDQDLFHLTEELMKSQNPPFHLSVAVDIMIQLVKGIGYLHKEDVAHRDLKPPNILVGKAIIPPSLEGYEGYVQVKVADFDQVKLLPKRSSKPELQSRDVGSTAWKAPEVFKSKDGSFGKIDSKKADIYSFGMICSEILSGKNPVVAMGIHRWEVHQHILKGGRPQLPARCPPLLRELVFDCWKTQPAERPEASEVRKRLLNIQSFLLAGRVARHRGHKKGVPARFGSFVLGTWKKFTRKSSKQQQAGLKDDNREINATFEETAVIDNLTTTAAERNVNSALVGSEVAFKHSRNSTNIHHGHEDSVKTTCGQKNVKLVVGLDFGTTHSGVAFATISEPDKLYTITEWPMQTSYCKTLTAIHYKLQANGQFSWGYEARNDYEHEVATSVSPIDDRYLTELKQHVSSGVSDKAVEDYLKEVVNFVMGYLRRFFRDDYPDGLEMDMIYWCLTVPSSWNWEAKDQMWTYLTKVGVVRDKDDLRTRMYPPLIVLEQEAALYHCYKEIPHDMLQPGDKLVVVDIGGGSVQVMVQVWVGDDELTYEVEVDACSSLDLCGDKLLETSFFGALSKKIGCNLEDGMKQYPSIKFALLQQLERLKNVAVIPASGQRIEIPATLQKFWNDTNRRSGGGKLCDWLELSPNVIQRIFDPFVKQVMNHIVNRSPQRTQIKFMFVVGGFAQLTYLLREIRNRFGAEKVVTPRNPGSVVCRGAVAVGLNSRGHEESIRNGSYSSGRGGGSASMDDGQSRHNEPSRHSQPGSSKGVQSTFPHPPTSSREASKGKGKMHNGKNANLQPVPVVVAVDFGTTHSRYAYASLDSSPLNVFQSATTFNTQLYYKEQHGSLQVHSWGHTAEVNFKKDFDSVLGKEFVDDTPLVGIFLSKFKLHLADSDGGMSIVSDLPPKLTVRDVISDYLREMGSVALTDLRMKYGQDLAMESVHWYVTVPSIWDDNAKQQMKACMFDAGLVSCPRSFYGSLLPSSLVLEPESALRGSLNVLKLQDGDRILVADIGGGTCDIIVQEWIGTDSRVEEVTSSKGGLCGSSFVDQNFLGLMSQRIGEWLTEYVSKSPALMLEILQLWEPVKCCFRESRFDDHGKIEVQLPAKLASAWEDSERRSGNRFHSSYDILEISHADLKAVFDPVVNMNLDLIAEQLSRTVEVQVMLVVGGFANSEYLMTRIRDKFASKVKYIIRPPNPEGVISQGAVALATNSEAVRSRVARKTYGLEMTRESEQGVCSPTSDGSDNGGQGGIGKFRIDVQRGKRANVDSCVSSIHIPIHPEQKRMTFTLYSSSKPYPRHVMEEAVIKEWEFMIEIPDSMELQDETPQVRVSMFYGRSSIEIQAVLVKFEYEIPSIELPVMVTFEHQYGKRNIDTSLAKRTYGIGTNKFREEFDSLSFHEESSDGKALCENRLEIYIKRGTKLNRWVSRTYFPMESRQEKLTFTLYSSPEVSPRYSTEHTVTKEEEFEVDITKGEHLDRNREISIDMFFEYKSITVRATALNFAHPNRTLPIKSRFGKWSGSLGIRLNVAKLVEAEASSEGAQTGREKALGSKHTSTLQMVNHLGNLDINQGKLAETEAIYEQAMVGQEKVLGPKHILEGSSINRQGGLASSIIQLVDLSAKVLARLRKFQSTVEVIPRVFQDIIMQLRLITDIMKRIEKGCGDYDIGQHASLSDIVEGCLRQVTLLNGLMENSLPIAADSRLLRIRKAFVGVRIEEKDLMAIQRTLETYKTTLTHFSSDIFGASFANTAKESTYFEIPSLQVSQYVKRVKLMEKIEASFINRESHQNGVVLLGMGGQGKTQLALEFCRAGRMSGRFQAIFWVDASSPNTVSRGFDTIVAKISITKRAFDDMESKITFVKETLEEWQCSWLLVFDSYDHPSAFRDIRTYFPRGKMGAILITSRHRDSRCLGVTIRITQMTEDESIELFSHQSKLERNEENIKEGRRIVKKLGYLPLAVGQAGAYICVRKLPLWLFEKHYNERREVVLKYTPSIWEYRKRLGEDKDETSLSVFTTWELSFQQINKNDKERAMIGHFLTLSAFIDATKVDEDLFKSHFASNSRAPQTWIEHFSTEGMWDTYKYEDVLLELSRLSLLQNVDIGGTKSHFSLHPLVTDWLKLRIGRKDCQNYALEAITMVTQYINSLDQATIPLHIKIDILSHVDVCARNVGKYLSGLDELDITSLLIESAYTFATFYHSHDCYKEAEAMYQQALAGQEKALGLEDISTLTTINNLGSLYQDQGKLAEAEAMYERALAGREKASGLEHISTLSTVYNLGSLYQDQNKLAKAGAMYERALAWQEKALGPQHISTLDKVNNLGNLYKHQGKLAEAEAMYERALAGQEKALGSKHISTLTTVNNLGSLYQDQGKLAKAEAMYERALAGQEKALGPQHISTLNTVDNLGSLYQDQGKLAEAEAMYERALAGREKALGPEHISTLNTVYNLGSLYQDQGKLADAEAMYERALVGQEKVLGPEHTSTLDTANNLGNLYKDQGKLAEAEAMYERALAGQEKALGPEHISTLITVNNLGSLYQDQGKLAEAEAMYERALTGQEKALGPEHTSTLDTANNLGNLYKDQGKLAEAEAMYERALAGQEKALGSKHISTLTTVNNLGSLYQDQGKLAKAEAMYEQALAGLEKALGPEHISTLTTVNNLGSLYQGQAKLAEAEAMYERALAGREKALGLEHTSTLNTVYNLGSLYQNQSKLAEAEAMYERALVKLEKALGPEHISTLNMVYNLGFLYQDQGKLAKAGAMYKRALAWEEKALGLEHISTLTTVNNLGNLYNHQGKLAEAEAMYERALAGQEKALGPEHTSTLDTVNNLGNLYKHQDKLAEAEAMYERALAGHEKALEPEHTSTLNTVNNLGSLYQDQGKLAEAEAMYERALAGREKALGPEHISTLNTVYNLGSLYQDQGKLADAEALYERALAGQEKALGPKHTSTLDTANNLGNLYRDQGKLAEAEAMYERAMAGQEKALGPEHISTLITVNNLGSLYQDQGKLAEAEAMYERALAGQEKALGPEHTSTLDTANNLGNLYKDQGKLAEAEAMYERALAGQEKALGSKHISTLTTINNLSSLYQDQGKLANAEAMYEQALAGLEKALGTEHISTLTTVNNLGSLYQDQGKLAEAEAMYERALAGREKALGPEHTSTLNTVYNLGSLYQDQGKFAEAEAMYERALAGREKALGPEHTSTLNTVYNLGSLYQDKGKLAKAGAMYKRALAGREKALGPEHTSTLNTVYNLGFLYEDQGKLAKAGAMYERALAWEEKALGPEHISTLTTVNNLGNLYKHQGKLAEAEAMYERALAGQEKVLGSKHISTLTTVNNLGSLYQDQGKLGKAKGMYERALAGREKALGPEHTSTSNTVNNLGKPYKHQNKLAEAEAMYERALAGHEKALEPEHTSTLNTVNNLGSLYQDQGKLAEAEAMYERALAWEEKALGPEHISTLTTVNNLGNLYKHQGKLAEAEAMYKRALAGQEKALGSKHISTLTKVNNLGSLYQDQGKLAEAEAMYKRALAGRRRHWGQNTLPH